MKPLLVICGILFTLIASVACAQWICEGGTCYQVNSGYAPVSYDYGYSQPVGISQGAVYSGYGSAGGFGSSIQAYGSTGGYATSYGSQGGYATSYQQSYGSTGGYGFLPSQTSGTTIVRQRIVTQSYGSTGSYAVPRRMRR